MQTDKHQQNCCEGILGPEQQDMHQVRVQVWVAIICPDRECTQHSLHFCPRLAANPARRAFQASHSSVSLASDHRKSCVFSNDDIVSSPPANPPLPHPNLAAVVKGLHETEPDARGLFQGPFLLG